MFYVLYNLLDNTFCCPRQSADLPVLFFYICIYHIKDISAFQQFIRILLTLYKHRTPILCKKNLSDTIRKESVTVLLYILFLY